MTFLRPVEKQTSPCISSESFLEPVIRFHPLIQQYQHSLHAYHSCELSTQNPSTSANLYALLFLTTNAMNWTGGRLQRHSGAHKGVTYQQKQHFAKAAQRLSHGSKFKSPVKWSVFDLIAEDRERAQRESSATHYIPTAPNREQSRQLTQHHNDIYRKGHVSGEHETRYPSKSSADRVHQHISRAQQAIKPSPIPGDDLYNATPPPRNIKRQREESVALSEIDSYVQQQEREEESVSEKRRRILRRGDWVGIGIQKPLQLAFASPRDEENVGRRRKIPKGGHRARYESRQTHITSPFPQRARCPVNVAPSAWAKQLQQIEAERADVRISIGGKVVPPGLSSSSAPHTAIRKKSQATPSDVMLLDHDDTSYSQRQDVDHNPLPSYDSPREHEHDIHHGSNHVQTQLQAEEPSNDFRSEFHQEAFNGWAGIYPNDEINYHDSVREAFFEERIEDAELKQPDIPEATASVRLNNSPYPGQVAFPSSSTSMYHPKPRSSRVSALIGSDSSERADSTIAEIGHRRPAVPSSQVEENGLWESWVAPLLQESSSQHTNDLGGRTYHTEVNISPGMSAVSFRRLSETHTTSDNEVYSGKEGSNAEEGADDSYSEQPQPQSSTDEDLSLSEDHDYSRLLVDPVMMVEAGSYPSQRDSPKTNSKPSAVVENREEDADEVWRKFVFGSSSDGLEEDRERMENTAHIWRDSRAAASSSMLAQSPTRQSIDSTYYTSSSSGQTPSSRSHADVSDNETQMHSAARSSQPLSTSSSLSQRSRNGSGSLAVLASSQSDRQAGHHPPKKAVFTRPKPFIGRRSVEQVTNDEPLHIGRHLLEDERKRSLGRNASSEYDTYSNTNFDEGDDIESIEDE